MDNAHGHHCLGILDAGREFVPLVSAYLQKNTYKRAKRVQWILKKADWAIFWGDSHRLKKLSQYLDTNDNTSAERVAEDLRYHETITIICTDLHQMGAGAVKRPYEKQIEEAIELKGKYQGRVRVFMMLDPYRENLMELVEKYQSYVDGWKLYPTWYFVTDLRLRPILDKYPKPVIVHCTDSSPVHWAGDLETLKIRLGELYDNRKTIKENCATFAHPKYIWLMSRKYRNINWSAAHFGGDNLKWYTYILNSLGGNLYADDSYTFNTPSEYSKLNELLNNKPNILHGTDYYMTKTEGDYGEMVMDYLLKVSRENRLKQQSYLHEFMK